MAFLITPNEPITTLRPSQGHSNYTTPSHRAPPAAPRGCCACQSTNLFPITPVGMGCSRSCLNNEPRPTYSPPTDKGRSDTDIPRPHTPVAIKGTAGGRELQFPENSEPVTTSLPLLFGSVHHHRELRVPLQLHHERRVQRLPTHPRS